MSKIQSEATGKTAGILVFSFLLPALLLLAAFAAMGMAPFGDRSTLIMDQSGQYVEFLCGLKSGDVFFSWSKSLGTNYIGLFAYYVSSPFSALTLLCPNDAMPVGVLFLTILKIGLSGLTFGLLLKYRFGTARPAVAVFSMLYGLMSYNIAYSMCIMWLDAVIWLPIVILGAEKILAGKGGGVFTAALFVSILSTYYISYMVALFVTLYFIYRCLEEGLPKKEFLCRFGRFVFGGLMAAALSAFLLLPAVASLLQGKLSGEGVGYDGAFTFALSDFFKKLLPFQYDSITNSGAPFLYCGLVSLILFPAFFFFRKVRLRSKMLTGAFFLILFFSMWIAPLDKVWHGFQQPNWFPYRYAFVVSFFVILTSYRAFLLIRLRRPLVLCLAAVTIFDLYGNSLAILNGLDTQFGYESYSSYRTFKDELTDLLQSTADDGDFYRIGQAVERTKNDAIGFGFNGMTHYSSAYNSSINALLSRMGCAQTYFWSSYFGSTMVTDALFSVRYVLSDQSVSTEYSMITENNLAALYENPFAISIGAAVSGEALGDFVFADDPFENQNQLVQALTGTDDKCFLSVDAEIVSGSGYTEYSFLSDGIPVYAVFSGGGSGSLYVNGEYRLSLFTSDTQCVQYIGTFDAGQEIHILAQSQGDVEGNICKLDMDVFKAAVDALKASEFAVEAYGNRKVTGSVTAEDGDVLFTTIPYDTGWSVYIDGEEAESTIFASALMTVPLTAGVHEIELVFTAPKRILGMVISLGAGLILLLLLFTKNRRQTGQFKATAPTPVAEGDRETAENPARVGRAEALSEGKP